MIEVKFVLPGFGDNDVRLAPDVPRVGDTVRFYGGPQGAGPCLYYVQNVIWDIPVGESVKAQHLKTQAENDLPSVQVWLSNKAPKGRRR